MSLEPYDADFAPRPFGQLNTGATCYWNSMMAALVSCTAFSRAVMANEDLLSTHTGRAMYAFIKSYLQGMPAADGTSVVLAALKQDLLVRCPSIKFGNGQESASEALVLLLDMLVPPHQGPPRKLPPGVPESHDSPITQLFLHRYRCQVHCKNCRNVVSEETDFAVNVNLFDMDVRKPTNPAEFSAMIRCIDQILQDYKCPACKVPTVALRHYELEMIPEIIVGMFNLYDGFGGAHRSRYFPPALAIPKLGGGQYEFGLVAQVEHWGGLGGGHYWARGLRKMPSPGLSNQELGVFKLNDTSVDPSHFQESANTYIIVYNYMRCTMA